MALANSVRDLFEGAAAKYLSAVDAEPARSNQHEIGGLSKAGFKQFLGTPGKGDKSVFSATMAYVVDEEQQPTICSADVTWYDCRDNDPSRSPEYRLYYPDNAVTEQLEAGDFFLIAKATDQTLLLVFTPSDTEIEHQLRRLFGIGDVSGSFQMGLFDDSPLVLPLRFLLEDLGVGAAAPDADDDELLSILQARFPGAFPRTDVFSTFARERAVADELADPDVALMAWMETEERMFRVFERHIVATRLRDGFGSGGDDVDAFISFSLSVQNRRKARVGRAFENHLRHLFEVNGLRFEQGSHHRVTENRAKPDFLFPSFVAYHDADYPATSLRLLGAKTSCKERWRQVLAEGRRVNVKHLVTLEPGITEHQTAEMQSKDLQLVVPAPVQASYSESQRRWLLTLGGFIDEIHSLQSAGMA